MVFKIKHEKHGIHIHCRLFAAKASNMTYAGCGEFCVREEEFEDLQRVMSGIFFEEGITDSQETPPPNDYDYD